MNIELKNKSRRRKILTTLKNANDVQQPVLSGTTLHQAANDILERDRRMSVYEFTALTQQLELKKYIEINCKLRKGEMQTLSNTYYKITAMGLDLIMENIGPDPMVEDDRIVE
jgi:hypothetical protein